MGLATLFLNANSVPRDILHYLFNIGCCTLKTLLGNVNYVTEV